MTVVDRIEFLLMALEVNLRGKMYIYKKRMNPLHGEVVTAGVMSIFYSAVAFQEISDV